jgi:hypothetical protein
VLWEWVSTTLWRRTWSTIALMSRQHGRQNSQMFGLSAKMQLAWTHFCSDQPKQMIWIDSRCCWSLNLLCIWRQVRAFRKWVAVGLKHLWKPWRGIK